MPNYILSLVVCLSLLLGTSNASESTDWPQWRGPHLNGTSTDSGWQSTWTDTSPPVLWEVTLPSGGRSRCGSSIVVAGGKVFVKDDSTGLQCLDAQSGAILWQGQPGTGKGDATPAVHGDRVFVTGDGELHCLAANSGKKLWSTDTGSNIHRTVSPLVVPGMVVVGSGGGFLSFDQTNGQEQWRTPAAVEIGKGIHRSSSPVYGMLNGEQMIAAHVAGAVVAIDPGNGQFHWHYDLLKLYPDRRDYILEKGHGLHSISTPILADGRLLAAYHIGHATKNPPASVAIALSSEQSKPKLHWKNPDLSAWWHSCVVHDGCLIGISQQRGGKDGLVAIDIATGKTLWHYDVIDGAQFDATQRYILVDGKLLVIGGKSDGVDNETRALVITVSRHEAVLSARFSIPLVEGHRTCPSPAFVDGRLYCRTKNKVVCMDLRPGR